MSLVSVYLSVAFGLEAGELVMILAMVGAGIVLAGWGVLNLRDGYQIFSNDPVDATAVRHESGVVEVSGTAKRFDETITAPYSGEDCLVYDYHKKVRENDAHDEDDDPPDWRTVDRGSNSVPFVVEDDSGRVSVDPAGASISMSDKDYSSIADVREIEARVDIGEVVHVFGHALRDDTGVFADAPVHIGDGDEVTYRIADTSGGRAVLRLLAKAGMGFAFGIVLVGSAVYIVTAGVL
jgi:hypothetical protein